MKIGVLGLQGAVSEHIECLNNCGVEGISVKHPYELDQVDGLIIPGGESTTIGKLAEKFGLSEPLKTKAKAGFPIMGTCAGLILLATDIVDSDQPRLGLIPMRVKRNAFGRQRESFETDLEIPAVGPEPFRAVFIRAPYIESIENGVEPMAYVQGKLVMARHGNLLAMAFHPELTDDLRIHNLFIEIVKSSLSS